MKSFNKQVAAVVLGLGVMGIGAQTASASLIGHIIGGVGDIVDPIVDPIIDDVVDPLLDEVLDPMDPIVNVEVGLVAEILAGAGIDLAPLGIDIGALSEADANALVQLKLLGVDLEALVNADVLAGLHIFTEDGLNVEALVCAVVDGSLDLNLLGHDIVAADILVALGLDADVLLNHDGLDIDLGLACGCPGNNGPDGPTDPTDPTDPNNPSGNPVPEPATAMLGVMGLGGLALAARRRRQA